MSQDALCLAPEIGHTPLLRDAPMHLAFDPSADFDDWRKRLRAKLRELLGMGKFQKADANLRILAESDGPGYRETRFAFTAEAGVDVKRVSR